MLFNKRPLDMKADQSSGGEIAYYWTMAARWSMNDVRVIA